MSWSFIADLWVFKHHPTLCVHGNSKLLHNAIMLGISNSGATSYTSSRTVPTPLETILPSPLALHVVTKIKFNDGPRAAPETAPGIVGTRLGARLKGQGGLLIGYILVMAFPLSSHNHLLVNWTSRSGRQRTHEAHSYRCWELYLCSKRLS